MIYFFTFFVFKYVLSFFVKILRQKNKISNKCQLTPLKNVKRLVKVSTLNINSEFEHCLFDFAQIMFQYFCFAISISILIIAF